MADLVSVVDAAWIEHWMKSVASGEHPLSQRARRSIDRHGGIEALTAAARKRGLHLAELTNELGQRVVTASIDTIDVFC
jgi:hypothetical protein